MKLPILAIAAVSLWAQDKPTNASLPLAAPKNAIVLFNGRDMNQWTVTLPGDRHWKVEQGSIVVDPFSRHNGRIEKCRLATKLNFDDVKLHVEFWLPSMPDRKGQARANSGVFLQGRYEVQMLDSYGAPPEVDGAGSLYKVTAPRVNASLPAEQWQSFDIEYRGPRFQGEDVTAAPRITVWYNEVKVHDNVRLEVTGTPNNAEAAFAKTGPIQLQNHAAPVRFRNIWVVKR